MRTILLLIGILGLLTSPAQARHWHHWHHWHHLTHHRVAQWGGGATVAHPSGCPGRAFCGCGAALRVFGRPVRSLWLAAAWFRFPRSAPAPGTVAVRRHHVFVLESHVEGNTWIVYDANSGGHATRIHPRSIAGYTIVNPHT